VRNGLCAFVGLLCAAHLHAGEVRVVGVSDGDTVTVLTADKQQIKIRLAGIDAPESSQAFGNRAKQALADKVGGKTIEVVQQSKDRYGRTVADLYLEGRWINLELVAEGWAWHYRQYSRDQRLADAETAARQAGLGLWADKDPVPPWGFRRGDRLATPVQSQTPAIEIRYWLNTAGNIRHNSRCRYFENPKSGRPCSKEDGKPCGVCGG